jgi:hypothetical protein
VSCSAHCRLRPVRLTSTPTPPPTPFSCPAGAARWAGGRADLQVFCESRRGDSNPGPPPYHGEHETWRCGRPDPLGKRDWSGSGATAGALQIRLETGGFRRFRPQTDVLGPRCPRRSTATDPLRGLGLAAAGELSRHAEGSRFAKYTAPGIREPERARRVPSRGAHAIPQRACQLRLPARLCQATPTTPRTNPRMLSTGGSGSPHRTGVRRAPMKSSDPADTYRTVFRRWAAEAPPLRRVAATAARLPATDQHRPPVAVMWDATETGLTCSTHAGQPASAARARSVANRDVAVATSRPHFTASAVIPPTRSPSSLQLSPSSSLCSSVPLPRPAKSRPGPIASA